MKYYKISEEDLRGLIEDALFSDYLLESGVDNWEWYGEALHSHQASLEKDIETILQQYKIIES